MATMPAWLPSVSVDELQSGWYRQQAGLFFLGNTWIQFCSFFAPVGIFGYQGVDADGQTLTAEVEGPDTSITPLTVWRIAQGIYAAAAVPTLVGPWNMRFNGTVNGQPLEIETTREVKAVLF